MALALSANVDVEKLRPQYGAYRRQYMTPLQGNGTITLSSTTQDITILQPNVVVDANASELEMDMFIPNTAGSFNRVHSNLVHLIDSYTYRPSSGVLPVDMRHIPLVSRTLNNKMTRLADFLDFAADYGAEVSADVNYRCSNCMPSNQRQLTDAGVDLPLYISTGGVNTGCGLGLSATNGFSTSVLPNFTGPAYHNTSGSNLTIAFKYRFPLRDITCRSLWSTTQDFFPNDSNGQHQFKIASVGQIGWKNTSNVAPQTGAANITASVTISNIRMSFMRQVNPDLANKLIEKTRQSGMNYLIPYLTVNHYVSPASTSVVPQYQLTHGIGDRLLQVFHTSYTNSSTGLLAYDNSNRGEAKWESLQTSLDSSPLQDQFLLSANGDVWAHCKDFLAGSASQGVDMFNYNPVMIDNFSEGRLCEQRERDAHVAQGKPLTAQPVQWQISINNSLAVAYRQLTVFVTQRTLRVEPNGNYVWA